MVEIFGLSAETVMVIMYALEYRSPKYILGFAAACLAAALYAWLIRSWPFAVVETVWAFIAVRRYFEFSSANGFSK